jgi:hypothetical protein
VRGRRSIPRGAAGGSRRRRSVAIRTADGPRLAGDHPVAVLLRRRAGRGGRRRRHRRGRLQPPRSSAPGGHADAYPRRPRSSHDPRCRPSPWGSLATDADRVPAGSGTPAGRRRRSWWRPRRMGRAGVRATPAGGERMPRHARQAPRPLAVERRTVGSDHDARAQHQRGLGRPAPTVRGARPSRRGDDRLRSRAPAQGSVGRLGRVRGLRHPAASGRAFRSTASAAQTGG